jgi:hypothetical protein
MVIRALDHVPHCYTYADGQVIAGLISERLSRAEDVVLSFDGVQGVPSSFVNAAFVGLLSKHSFADVRRYLRVIHSTKQINTLIKERLEREAKRFDYVAA